MTRKGQIRDIIQDPENSVFFFAENTYSSKGGGVFSGFIGFFDTVPQD